MTQEKTVPWYKQFWPWFIIALPLTSVVAASTCVYIAFKNQDAVVQEDWDEDSAKVNDALQREHKAVDMGLSATLTTDQLSGDLTVAVTGKNLQQPKTLQLKISHPTDAKRDQVLNLALQQDGKYHASLNHALNGRYYLVLEARDWRLRDEQTFPQPSLTIAARAN